MSENRFNTVVILDSIPKGELNSARRLNEDLEIIASAKSPAPGITYARVETKNDFLGCINQIINFVEHNQVFPLIHLEAHGSEDGIQMAGGSQMSWVQIIDALIPLNIAMELNLLLVLATCHGGTFIRAISITDRAPVWGLIGPTQELSAGQIETDFGVFYRTFFETLSPTKALDALNQADSNNIYYRNTAEVFFNQVWKGYKNNHCTDEKLRERARKMYKKAKKEKIHSLQSVGHFKRQLKSQERGLFSRFRDTFFMCDLFPSHRDRFEITYEKSEAYAAR